MHKHCILTFTILLASLLLLACPVVCCSYVRRLYQEDQEESIKKCMALLDEPSLDTAVRTGDVFGLLIEHYSHIGNYQQVLYIVMYEVLYKYNMCLVQDVYTSVQQVHTYTVHTYIHRNAVYAILYIYRNVSNSTVTNVFPFGLLLVRSCFAVFHPNHAIMGCSLYAVQYVLFVCDADSVYMIGSISTRTINFETVIISLCCMFPFLFS